MDADSVFNTDEKFVSSIHAKGSLEKMRDLFMSQKLTDVILVVSDVEITAHRLVLSSASDYFRAMFTGDFLEANMARVQMEGTDPVALQALVDFCYSGEIDLSEDNVETILSTANVLQIAEVVNACCNFLATRLNPSNCIGFSLFSESQGCIELHQFAHTYVMDHFTDVIVNQEYLSLPAEEVKRLLSSDMLNVPSEEAFQSLMLWVNYDLPNRKKDLPFLLETIKLPLLTPQDFDLCAACYGKEGHNHKMVKLSFGLDESAAWDQNQANLQESHCLSIQRSINNLAHACQCRVANCQLPRCRGMKRVVQHIESCKKRILCPICKQLIALSCYHTKRCQEAKCPFPYCRNGKIKQKLQRLLLDQTTINRRMFSAVFQTSPGNSNSSSQLSRGTLPHSSPQVMSNPGPSHAGMPRPAQAWQRLLRTLKSPPSAQQQKQVLAILKSYPQLMAEFIKQRIAHRKGVKKS